MKYVLAISTLLILIAGCAPSGNMVSSQSPTLVDNQSAQALTADDNGLLKARITSLESSLANCQSTSKDLQWNLDQWTKETVANAKEPVSGHSGSYNLVGDNSGSQYPNKYITWDIQSLQYSAWKTEYPGHNQFATMIAKITNNHPTLALTNVTVNNIPIGSPTANFTLAPGESFTFTKNMPIQTIVNFQVTLQWVWQ